MAPPTPSRRAHGSDRWLTLGAIGLALTVVGGIVILDRRQGDAPSFEPQPGAPVASSPTPPDISAMTPLEAAERLFNRVMAASEQGNMDEANRFVPMALMAYEQLGELDVDGHYHVGLIRTVAEDDAGAEAELDAMRRMAPDHLLGFLLEHAVAEIRDDRRRMTRAIDGFLDAYDAEMKLARSEYQHHANGIRGFRERIQANR